MHISIQLLLEGISATPLYDVVKVHKTLLEWRNENCLTLSRTDPQFITINPVTVLVTCRMFQQNVTDCAVCLVTAGNVHVQSDTKAVCFISMLHVRVRWCLSYHIISLVVKEKLQMYL
jgi:hypothetical protein